MWVKTMKEPSRGKACLGCGDRYKHDLLRVRLIWSENCSSEVAVRCLSQGWIFIHWSSLSLRLPSSLVENPKMEWDLILNCQICQTQEQSLSLLRWFCLRYGVSGVDSKCLLVCFGCTLGPRFRMYPWTFDPSCTQIGPVLLFALMMISQARRPSCWPH